MKLSVIIIAKDEEKNIIGCLNSVAFADEIIVVDDYSDDKTVDFAKQQGAIVFQRALDGDFAAQQNFGIDKASGDWLLFLDCDERITPALAEEIKSKVQCNERHAYSVRRLNHFAGQPVMHGVLRPDFVCRLLPNQGVRFGGMVHQKLEHRFTEKKLTSPMLHYTYISWSQYYRKFEQYTRLAAKQYAQQGKTVNVLRDFIIRPFWAFFKVYVIHRGFLDGKIGWLLAVNHYHYTQTKYSRLYAIQHFGEDAV